MPEQGAKRTSSAAAAPSDWPGQRIGLPREGVGSVARPGRRLGALAIDFAACYLIYLAFFFGSYGATEIFVLEQVVLIWTVGGGFGHIVMGLRLVRLDGSRPGAWRPVVRTLLLCLVIPALVWDSDQRGLHDVFSGTVLVRVR